MRETTGFTRSKNGSWPANDAGGGNRACPVSQPVDSHSQSLRDGGGRGRGSVSSRGDGGGGFVTGVRASFTGELATGSAEIKPVREQGVDQRVWGRSPPKIKRGGIRTFLMMSLFVRFEDGMPSEDKAFLVACLSPECHLSWSRTDHRAAASTTVHLHKFLL
jgi:hypothetical protein